jgi:hypothetical protein
MEICKEKSYQICKGRIQDSSINNIPSIYAVLCMTEAHCHISLPRDRVNLEGINCLFYKTVGKRNVSIKWSKLVLQQFTFEVHNLRGVTYSSSWRNRRFKSLYYMPASQTLVKNNSLVVG